MEVGGGIGLEGEVDGVIELAGAAGEGLGEVFGGLEGWEGDVGGAEEAFEEVGEGGDFAFGGFAEAEAGIGQAGGGDAVAFVPELEVEVIRQEEVIEVGAVVVVLVLGVAGEFLELGVDGLCLDVAAG